MRPYTKLTPIEVRQVAHTTFKQDRSMTLEQMVAHLVDKGCAVQICNHKNQHLKVTGKVRVVNYYGTTGTVYAEEVEGVHPMYKQRGMELVRSLERTVALANVGY